MFRLIGNSMNASPRAPRQPPKPKAPRAPVHQPYREPAPAEPLEPHASGRPRRNVNFSLTCIACTAAENVASCYGPLTQCKVLPHLHCIHYGTLLLAVVGYFPFCLYSPVGHSPPNVHKSPQKSTVAKFTIKTVLFACLPVQHITHNLLLLLLLLLPPAAVLHDWCLSASVSLRSLSTFVRYSIHSVSRSTIIDAQRLHCEPAGIWQPQLQSEVLALRPPLGWLTITCAFKVSAYTFNMLAFK